MTKKKMLMAIGGKSASGVRMIVIRFRFVSKKTWYGKDIPFAVLAAGRDWV
jgi:hypothetical protein